MAWVSWGGFFSCVQCGLQAKDPRRRLTDRWTCKKCGHLVDDGQEWRRAEARGDSRLLNRLIAEERAYGEQFERARALQHWEECDSCRRRF